MVTLFNMAMLSCTVIPDNWPCIGYNQHRSQITLRRRYSYVIVTCSSYLGRRLPLAARTDTGDARNNMKELTGMPCGPASLS